VNAEQLERNRATNLRELAPAQAFSIELTAENDQNVIKRLRFRLTLTSDGIGEVLDEP
jgi:hypothetical protein